MKNASLLVLIVDDEPLIRELAATVIAEAGFEVVQAASADEALGILSARKDVGLLFTDINMPGQMDGLALARLVHEHWPDIQLVLTSGRPLPEPAPQGGQFMAKPYSLDKLAETVTDLAKDSV